jgi:hypothetical protein
LNKTAVQSLFERLKNDYGLSFSENVEKDFLEMEKQQIFEAYDYGFENPNVTGEQYYKETYE